MKQKCGKEKKGLFDKIIKVFNGDFDIDEVDFSAYDFDYDREVMHEKKNVEKKSKIPRIETPIRPVDEPKKKETSIKATYTKEDRKKEDEAKNDYWTSAFESTFSGKEEKKSSERVITVTENNKKSKKDEKTKNEVKSKTEVKEKEDKDGLNQNNKKNKKVVSLKGVTIGAASIALALAAGYAIANRNREVESTNSSIISAIGDKTHVDEIFDEYNEDAANYNDVVGNETIDTILSGENNIVSAADKLSDLIMISDELESYDLEEALKLNGDVRSLNNEEKEQIRNMSRADLLQMMDSFKEMGDVDIQAFDKKSVDYSYLTMKLSFAKYIIDNQIMKYGTDILSTYPELIIQAVIINESNFEPSEYVNVDIKLIDGNYYACYKAVPNGSHYNVLLESKANKLIKDKDYFDGFTSDKDSFKDFKEKALKTLNDCKIMLLADCKIKHSGSIQNTRYELETSSNFKVFIKADKVK